MTGGPYVVVITREADAYEVAAPVGIPQAELMFGLRRLPTGLHLASAGMGDDEAEPTVLIRFDRNGLTPDAGGKR